MSPCGHHGQNYLGTLMLHARIPCEPLQHKLCKAQLDQTALDGSLSYILCQHAFLMHQ